MPAPLIPTNKVEQLNRQGLSAGEIVTWLAENEGIVVTRQGVSQHLARKGITSNTANPKVMPWVLRPEHTYVEAARCIRWYARRIAGKRLSADANIRLDKMLDALKAKDAVLHYEPTLGFVPVARRPAIDLGIVREPDGDRTA